MLGAFIEYLDDRSMSGLVRYIQLCRFVYFRDRFWCIGTRRLKGCVITEASFGLQVVVMEVIGFRAGKGEGARRCEALITVGWLDRGFGIVGAGGE